MAPRSSFLARISLSAVGATATSIGALAAVAVGEGRGALQPLNATSHWLHGRRAADVRDPDLRHTGVGVATHAAATIFWAILFEAWIGPRRPLPPLTLGRDAAAMAAVAAAVDYLATPKRFTPGWEFVLSKKAMALTYAAMAAGLFVGAYVADEHEFRRG